MTKQLRRADLFFLERYEFLGKGKSWLDTPNVATFIYQRGDEQLFFRERTPENNYGSLACDVEDEYSGCLPRE